MNAFFAKDPSVIYPENAGPSETIAEVATTRIALLDASAVYVRTDSCNCTSLARTYPLRLVMFTPSYSTNRKSSSLKIAVTD